MALKYIEEVATNTPVEAVQLMVLTEIAHQLDRIADALEEQNKGLDNRLTHELKR